MLLSAGDFTHDVWYCSESFMILFRNEMGELCGRYFNKV